MEEKIDSDSTKPDNLPTFNCHACHKIFPDALEALDCIEKHMETVQTPIELKQDCQEIIESIANLLFITIKSECIFSFTYLRITIFSFNISNG